MENTRNMTYGSPAKLLVSFGLPLMFANMFQQLYSVVDTAIIGQGAGMVALAAIGSVEWLNWLFLGTAQSLTFGCSVRIAQKFGQQDYVGLQNIMGASVVLCGYVALIGVFLAQMILPVFMGLLQFPADLYNTARTYSRIILSGFPIVILFNFSASCLRAVGDSKTPLYAMIISSICNIILDCIAVFVLKWGAAGAAAATVISQCFSAVFCTIRLAKTSVLRFRRQHISTGRCHIPDLIKLGVPMAVKTVVICISGMTMQRVVNSFDTAFIAGYTATNRLYGLLELAASAFGQSITTYVGQNYGAMCYDRIKKGIKAATVLCLIISISIAAVMILFGRPITMIFISTKSAQMAAIAGQTAYTYLCTMCAALPALYLLFVYTSALHGLGNTFAPMFSSVTEFVVRIGFAIFVGITGYQFGVFAAESMAWLTSAILLGICYSFVSRKLFTRDLCSQANNPL